MNKVIQGDCLIKLKELEDNSVDSIVTDPPYELGFMGKKWDNSGIAYNIDMWKECLRVLKPGGHLLAFGGTRTYHRMAVAIEDAGFEVRDMIEWVYGSGFPKSLNIGKAVDKIQGNEREVTGYDTNTAPDLRDVGAMSKEATGIDKLSFGQNPRPAGRKQIELTKGTSEWEGWGTALKPSHEPICMARKPLAEKTVAENVLKYGTGGINIDESRVGTEEMKARPSGVSSRAYQSEETTTAGGMGEDKIGRFPANLIHDNSEEVRECFPDAGKGNGKGAYNYAGREYDNKDTSMFNGDKPQAPSNFNDSGNASRFFKSIAYYPKASKKERNMGLDNSVLIDIILVLNNKKTLCEKNSIKEVKLAQLLVSMEQSLPKVTVVFGTQNKSVIEWSIGLFGKDLMEKYQKVCKSTILTKTHSITILQTYNWLLHLLTKEYIADVNLETAIDENLVESAENFKELIISINEKMASALDVKNVQSPTQLKISVKEGRSGHPTVKPIALMEYLIKMITPKGGVVLDQFAGSGSTLVAAKKNGYQYIGIELTEEYIPIIEARLSAVKEELKLF